MTQSAKKDSWSTGAMRGVVVWLSGRPATGKSTLGEGLCARLRHGGLNTLWLDGERVRSLVAPELGFTPVDQHAFEVRLTELVRDTAQRHDVVVVSAAAPSKAQRAYVRSIVPCFLEVALTAPADLLAKRDPKGLYEKVRSGLLSGVPGIDAPYDEPTNADCVLSTESKTVTELVEELAAFVRHSFATRGGDQRGEAR